MTLPSLPPEENMPSCTGCHLTVEASFLWPRNVCISSFRFLQEAEVMRMVQQRAEMSPDVE